MNIQAYTPTIGIAIGRETRLYHAYVTTAPPKLDAPATLTLDAAPLSYLAGWAADPIAFDPARGKEPARLVLVESGQINWQEARYDQAKHLFTPADPVRVGLDTLQHRLWSRLGAAHPELELATA